MTSRPTHRSAPGLLLCFAAAAAACSKPSAADPHPHEETPMATNRIDVPDAVQKNLGITFVKVERRIVAATLRLPGHWELLPQARHEHRTPLAGRVRIRVQPLQQVAAGDVLYSLDSPAWRELQRDLGEIDAQLTVTKARLATMQPLLAAHEAHEASLVEAAKVMEARIRELETTRASVGGQAQSIADAKVQLAQVRAQAAEAAEQHTETEAKIVELQANERTARERQELVLASAAAIAGTDVAALTANGPDGRPLWRTLGVLDVKATAAGIVDTVPLASGAWAADHELVATVSDVAQVRFRARALQSDLGRLRAGLPTTVVPATGNVDPNDAVTGTLQLGVDADPTQRTIDVFTTPNAPHAKARSGVAAFVEIETISTGAPELAIPKAAVMQDGLQKVFFRRDPNDRDKVIRVDADLGLDDGRWIVVKSGLMDGDEVVAAGAYELMLASSGSAPKGGHFHADGTFHADDHK